MTDAHADRRLAARASVSLLGSVQEGGGDPNPIVILSLSSSGTMIQTHDRPREGVRYVLNFTVHQRTYEAPIDIVGWIHEKDAYGWRCRFVELSAENAKGIEQAVQGALGLTASTVRNWDELTAEARAKPDGDLVVGQTPAGFDVVVKASDLLQMDAGGLELYVRMISELERM